MARANALFVYAVGFRRGLQARMYVSLMPPPPPPPPPPHASRVYTCNFFSSSFNGELLIRCNKRNPYVPKKGQMNYTNVCIINKLIELRHASCRTLLSRCELFYSCPRCIEANLCLIFIYFLYLILSFKEYFKYC